MILFAAFSTRVFSQTPVLPEYKIGDKARADVVTPVPLVVIDPEGTEKVRQQEAQRVPAIFRFYPNVVEASEANLRSTFAAVREKFLGNLETSYGRRMLNTQAVHFPRFQRFLALFQIQDKTFPLSANLAQVWAQGDSDELVVAGFVTKLRQTMEHCILVDPLPPGTRLGPQQIRLLTVKSTNTWVDLALVEKQGVVFFRTNIYTLTRARKELQNSFPAEDAATGNLLTSFVKENCVFDEELTRQSRAKRTDPIWAADHYKAGQVIVRTGEIIDAKAKLALDELKTKTAADQARAQVAEERLKAQVTAARLREQVVLALSKVQTLSQRNRWLLTGLIFFAVFFTFTFPLMAERKRRLSLQPSPAARSENTYAVILSPERNETIFVPVQKTPPSASIPSIQPKGSLVVPGESTGDGTVELWKERALAAEQRAEKAALAARQALLPHLARWLMDKLVRSLISQRAHLIETQQQAGLDLAELERRLARVQAPIEERLRTYEQRIAELEKELTVKAEENRELIKATVSLAQKKVQAGQSTARVPWN